MKKCLGFGCIFKADNLNYVGDIVVDLTDGTFFLTNTNGASYKLTPWIILKSFEYFNNKFKILDANFDNKLFNKFKISKEIESLIRERYKA